MDWMHRIVEQFKKFLKTATRYELFNIQNDKLLDEFSAS